LEALGIFIFVRDLLLARGFDHFHRPELFLRDIR
jgi:hypothetical protein